MTQPTPRFERPWHADVFALTVHLNETGVFSWADWTDLFGRSLQNHRLSKELDGGNDYFLAWVDALEEMLQLRGLALAKDLADLKADWVDAYERTPHGEPVRL